MKNKKSAWSNIILAISIIIVISIVVSLVSLMVQLPAAREVAEAEVARQGLPEATAQAVVDMAVSTVVAGVVLGVTFKVFEAIGGFLFSLKGKWGMFCVVVSIIIVVINSINLLGIFGGGKDAHIFAF